MLKLRVLLREYYVVKENDDIESVCRAANVSPVALCKLNGINGKEALLAGTILRLPPNGNLYTVQPGDSRENLCGTKTRYEELNGTSVFFPGMKVRI